MTFRTLAPLAASLAIAVAGGVGAATAATSTGTTTSGTSTSGTSTKGSGSVKAGQFCKKSQLGSRATDTKGRKVTCSPTKSGKGQYWKAG